MSKQISKAAAKRMVKAYAKEIGQLSADLLDPSKTNEERDAAHARREVCYLAMHNLERDVLAVQPPQVDSLYR